MVKTIIPEIIKKSSYLRLMVGGAGEGGEGNGLNSRPLRPSSWSS